MSELEDAAIAFFRAIRVAGRECMGHDQFNFRVDVTTQSLPEDKDGANLLGKKLQEALDLAGRTVLPLTVEGTTLQ